MEKKKTYKKKYAWTANNVCHELDIFGKTLPQFNFRGKDVINTRTGGVFTVFIMTLVLAFAAIKFI